MDRQALQRTMREAISDSRALREETKAAIAEAQELCGLTRKTLERWPRGTARPRLVVTGEDDSTDTD